MRTEQSLRAPGREHLIGPRLALSGGYGVSLLPQRRERKELSLGGDAHFYGDRRLHVFAPATGFAARGASLRALRARRRKLAGRRADGRKHTLVASRPAGVAHPPPVLDEPQREPAPLLRRHQRVQVVLDGDRIGLAREAKPARQPSDVGVDRQPGKIECHRTHDVARLATDARQRHQVVEIARDLAVEAFFDRLRHAEQAAGLGAEEAGGADELLDPRRVGAGEIGRRRILGEQRRGHHVHALVGRLRRENRRDEQLVRIRMIERAAHVGIELRQAFDHDRRPRLRTTRTGHDRAAYVKPRGTLRVVPGPEIITAGPSYREAIAALDRSVRDATGHPALGDAVWRDLAHPQPDSICFVARTADPNGGFRDIAYVHVARSDTFAPRHWVLGLAREPSNSDADAVTELLAAADRHIAAHGGGNAIVWLFDPSPADDELLEESGFKWQRDLYQMRVALPLAETATFPSGIEIRTFEPGRDEAAWLEVNNRAFGNHPDQGGWVAETLSRRMAEPWFDPSLFLLAFDHAGLAGFNWLKVHESSGPEPRIGEIFVIGVDPSRQGTGLGRALALEGLARISALGITTGMLFVAAENTGALALYRSLGFTVHRLDRAYEHDVEAA